jgi:hypothetical protein
MNLFKAKIYIKQKETFAHIAQMFYKTLFFLLSIKFVFL